jgi:hypothetical protein
VGAVGLIFGLFFIGPWSMRSRGASSTVRKRRRIDGPKQRDGGHERPTVLLGRSSSLAAGAASSPS